jgi:hypothetical protein
LSAQSAYRSLLEGLVLLAAPTRRVPYISLLRRGFRRHLIGAAHA